MKPPFKSKILGDMEIIEIFAYHDIPRVFIFETHDKKRYLADWSEEIEVNDQIIGDKWDIYEISEPLPKDPYRFRNYISSQNCFLAIESLDNKKDREIKMS